MPASRREANTPCVKLQIDPNLSIVWRSPSELQIGAPRAIAVVTGVGPWELEIVERLRAGVELAELRDRAAQRSDPLASRRLEVVVASLERALSSARHPNEVELRVALVGEDWSRPRLERAIGGIGLQLTDLASADVAVLSASFVVRPEHYQPLLAADRRHLPVIFDDDRVRVGPLIVPGRGPCVYCLERAQVDLDENWPAVAAQLQRRVAPSARTVLVTAAAVEVAFMLSAFVRGEPVADRVTTLTRHGMRVRSEAAPHPNCKCHSLEEIARVLADPAPPMSQPRPPMRAAHG